MESRAPSVHRFALHLAMLGVGLLAAWVAGRYATPHLAPPQARAVGLALLGAGAAWGWHRLGLDAARAEADHARALRRWASARREELSAALLGEQALAVARLGRSLLGGVDPPRFVAEAMETLVRHLPPGTRPRLRVLDREQERELAASPARRWLASEAGPDAEGWSEVMVPVVAEREVVALIVLRQGEEGGSRSGTTLVRGVAGALGACFALVRASRREDDLEERLGGLHRLQALGRIAEPVAGEFDAILAELLQYADALAADREDESELAEDLRAAARQAATLARLLAPRHERSRPGADLSAVLSANRSLMQRLAGPAVEVVVEEPSRPLPVRLGELDVEQVLLNLVVNAAEAIVAAREGGGGRPLGHVRVGVREARRMVVVEVADDGPGMEPAVLRRAQESFFTTKPRGTGLGLSTVRRIVEGAGGTVHIDSAPGAGTLVTLAIPRSA